MKKSTATKRAKGSSSSSFEAKRFVSAEVEARFHDLVKRRPGLKEQGFEIDSPHLEYIETIITRRGWQEFCRPPKVATMMVVCEFYVNTFEGPVSATMASERQIIYDAGKTKALLKIENATHGPYEVAQMDSIADLDEVSREICDKVVN